MSPQYSRAATVPPIHRLKLAQLLEMPENQFAELVSDMERNPLFKRFYCAEQPEMRLFGYHAPAGNGATTGFFAFDEGPTPSNGTGDAGAASEERTKLAVLVSAMGRPHFEAYFLYNDGGSSVGEIASACGITPSDVLTAMELVNKVSIHDEFHPALKRGTVEPIGFSKVASFRVGLNGSIDIVYSSLRYGRGRYSINYEKLNRLKKEQGISSEEYVRLRQFVQGMEMVNLRKTAVTHVVEQIAVRQSEFLRRRDPAALKALTQVELAEQLDVHCSTISRAMAGKSVAAPWGDEMPLKTFLVKGPVFRIKAAMQRLFDEEQADLASGQRSDPWRDDQIRDILIERFSERIATRTVVKYRSEMGIANVYVRTQRAKDLRAQRAAAGTPPATPRAGSVVTASYEPESAA